MRLAKPVVASPVKGPLAGVRILDLTHIWAGPLAVRALADLGATVVKIERPLTRGPRAQGATPVGGWLGDPTDTAHWNRNGAYIKLHRNRFGLVLDYKQDAGRELFLQLVQQADVVVENYSAHAMAAMKLGYEELSAANPKIIYVTMPGYGSTGPYSDRVAFGTVIESLSALTHMLGYSADELYNSAQALPDAMGGMHTVSAITSALAERKRTGTGARIEVSLHEAGVTTSGPWLIAEQLGEQPSAMGNAHPKMAPHGIYPCAGDDQWLAIGCENDQQWQSICAITGMDGLDWNLASRKAHAESIDRAITDWTSSRTKDGAAEELQAAGIPAGPVNSAPDMLADQQLNDRGFYAWHDRFGVPFQGDPVHRNESGVEDWLPSPYFGEHNREVLSSWLGCDDETLDQLEAASIIVQTPPE